MTSNQFETSDFKKTLLTRLLNGVKGCQSRFGSRSELATEDEESVTRLCSAYEDVFSHGFKKAVQQSSSSNKASFWVPAVLRSSETSSFWPLIKSQLSKHEAERFLLLHNVRTDVGRCRAWIRASLNEHSLERYILIILSLQNLHEFYEHWAFLRDHELNAILPQTAAGLGSVLFALTVDNPKFDTLIHVMEKDVPEATVIDNAQDDGIEVADQAILALSPASLAQRVPSATLLKTSGKTGGSSSEEKVKGKNCKKKKKKPPVNFVSFDDDDDTTRPADGVSANTSASLYSSLPATAVSTPTEKLSHSFRREEDSKERQEGCSSVEPKATHQPPPTKDKTSMSAETRSKSEGGLQPEVVKDSENESSEPSMDTPFSANSTSIHVDDGLGASGADPSICSTSVKSVDCISVNSVYSDCSERLDMESVSLAGLEVSPSQRLKPIVNDLTGGSSGSIRSVHSGNSDFSHDLIPVPSYDSTLAPDLHLDVETQFTPSSKIQSPATPITPGKSVGPTVPTPTTISRDNLDNSTTSLEYTTRNEDAIQKLKAILDREIETVATLRAELAEEKRSSNNQIKILEAKIESLSKENEILRHQLKKYVGAVQLLKREGSRRLSLEEDDNGINNCASADNEIDDSSQEAAEYERKLIQVAEMHGELMEFNAHLQKTILKKDAAIRRLKEELVDLRGPLATPTLGGGEDDDDEDSWDIVDSFSSAENSRSRSAAATVRRLASGSNERILINIWIPSAFLTGATNDLHHVYQVFVRIKDTEWNIYRRYSQFFSLHRDLSKNDQVVASLYFPPKKHLGNKDVRFVDERRRKLQEYLRAVMNHTLQTNSVLASHPEKNLLITILPFFGESFNTQTQKPKRERSRTRNLFFRQSGQSSQVPGQGQQPLQIAQYPQYTGL